MQEKWRIFWRESITKSARSIAIWPPIIGTGFLLANLPAIKDLSSLKQAAIPTFIYVYSINAAICIAYFFAWLIATTGNQPRMMGWMKKNLVVHFIISLTGTSAGAAIANAILHNVLGHPRSTLADYWSGLFIAGFISGLFILFYAYRDHVAKIAALEKSSVESQLQTLKSQLQPHFLFNSLNSLTELIAAAPESAAGMAQKLADLYRMILENSKLKTASLESELSIVQGYLAIEKLRFDDRLTFTINNASLNTIYLPALMLQTLVENAVKHGIAKAITGGAIRITVTPTAADKHKISICNTGAQYRPPQVESGTGLTNTRQRLELLYGNTHEFTIATNGAGLTEVSFYVSGKQFY